MGMVSHRAFVDSHDERFSERTRLRLEAGARIAGGADIACQVFDVSTTGILIETEVDVPLTTRLEITLPVLQRCMATAVWRSEDLVGCQFDEPLSLADVDALRHESPVVYPSFGRIDLDHSPMDDRRGDGDAAADGATKMQQWSARRRLATIVALAATGWAVLIGTPLLLL